jgi:hypothetical protein
MATTTSKLSKPSKPAQIAKKEPAVKSEPVAPARKRILPPPLNIIIRDMRAVLK